MKKTGFIVAILISILLSSLAMSVAQPVQNSNHAKKSPEANFDDATALDRIVAVVNDDVITQSELNHAIAMLKLQMAQSQVPNPPSNEEMQQQVLDQLITKKLQMQLAKEAKIEITDEEVNQTVTNLAKQNNVTVDELYEHVKQEGLSKTEYRSELQNQLMLQKLQQQEVASHINITREEVKRFAKNKTWQEDVPVEKEYQIEDILVPLTDNATDNDINNAKKHAYILLAQLKKKHDYKITDSDVNVTDLGYRRITQIPSAFAKEIPKLKPKEIAGPIQTGNGFHIIRLAAERALGNKKPEQPNMKQVEQLLFQHKFEEAMQTWLSKLRSQAFILTNIEK